MGTLSPKRDSSRPEEQADCTTHLKRVAGTALVIVLFLFIATLGNSNGRELSSADFVNSIRGMYSGKKDSTDGASPWFVVEPDEGEFTPKLVWLMSYPNSGTSFTMMSVLRGSGYSTATNYGDEVTADGDFSLPIYPRRSEGPFWNGLSEKLGKPRPLPTKWIMTKTHCGSRCVNCGPKEYTETLDSYIDACRKSSGRMPPDHRLQLFSYPVERVAKVIHLFRNPIHNMVARFHLEIKNYIKRDKKDWLERHPNNATGFRRWCKELDQNYNSEEREIFERAMYDRLQMTPCHGEIFKYVQWHNLAFETTKRLGVPAMYVHYENYEDDFNGTLTGILDYLELDWQHEVKPFHARHDYDGVYVTNEERLLIREAAKQISTNETWEKIFHYFPHEGMELEDQFGE